MINNLKSQNIKIKLTEHINPFLENLKQRKDILGIILLGGLGKRDFLDKFSDVDISVITYKKDRDRFPIPFEFHYFYDEVNCIEFNVHQLLLEDELDANKKWNEGKIEAYSNAIIYDDPFGYAKKIIELKAVFDEEKAFDRLIWIMQQYKWRGQIHSLRCYERGFPESGQDLLNHCLEMLLEAVFLLNKVYLPHRKWTFTFLENLKKGSDLKNLFSQAMLIPDMSLDCAKRRITILDEIYSKVWEIIYEKYPNFPKEPYEYYFRHYVQISDYTIADKVFLERTGKMRIESREDKMLFGDICYNVDKL